MKYEVENKFAVADATELRGRLDEAGVQWTTTESMIDQYFAHPSRDFSKTDEALRIRSVDEDNFVTYKGPKLPGATKTRRELELPIGRGEENRRAFAELLESLGFRPVAEVRKQRRHAELAWQNNCVTVCWDEVDELGTFIELELTVDERELATAQACIVSLAAELGLAGAERRSYLGMLLERRRAAAL